MMCQLAVFPMISAQWSSVGRISADGAEGRAHDDARDSLITKGVSRRRYLGSGGRSWAALVPIAAHTNAAAAAPSMIHCSVKLSPRVDPVPVAHAESREQDKKDARTIWHKKNSSRSLTVLPRMGNRGLLARK